MATRVKYRKHLGDDRYSYAVFVDGVPKWTGLSLHEARHYQQIERDRIGEEKKR